MLIKIYEAANPTTLPASGTLDLSLESFGFYLKRYDCVLYTQEFGNIYKIFRDGSAVRCCGGGGVNTQFWGYDLDLDRVFTMENGSGLGNVHQNTVGLKYDPSDHSRVTHTGILFPDGVIAPVVWGNSYYHGYLSHGYNKYDNATGTLQASVNTTGILTYLSDRIMITPDGWFVGIDADNGTTGVVRFLNLYTGATYESYIEKSKCFFIDPFNKNIWSFRASDSRMQIYTFDVAPSSVSSITMGSNRKRYREDDLSVTLLGDRNEPVPNWPVHWELTTAEGHLKETVTLTDYSGVATNTYCGPGRADFVGGSQTITVSTGY